MGYLFGEGIREPLRVRAGWVPDHVIKQLETFVTTPPPAALAIPAQGGPFAVPVPALQPTGGPA